MVEGCVICLTLWGHGYWLCPRWSRHLPWRHKVTQAPDFCLYPRYNNSLTLETLIGPRWKTLMLTLHALIRPGKVPNFPLLGGKVRDTADAQPWWGGVHPHQLNWVESPVDALICQGLTGASIQPSIQPVEGRGTCPGGFAHGALYSLLTIQNSQLCIYVHVCESAHTHIRKLFTNLCSDKWLTQKSGEKKSLLVINKRKGKTDREARERK